MESFAGKVAVVTGAASGIGRAIAERFGREGMTLVIADIEEPALAEAAGQLRAGGAEVLAVPVDVSERRSVENLRDQAVQAYGTVHVAVNNAGVEGYMEGPVWEASPKDWEWTLGVNFGGAVNGCSVFLPMLVAQDEGYVVNTSSVVAAWTAGGLYGVSKHAVLALSEAVYADLRAAGSKVAISVLCPGGTATRLFSGRRNRPERLRNDTPPRDAARGDAIRKHMHERVARAMPPAEVAGMLVQAMREERFYVFTGHQWDDRIRGRAENMLTTGHPVLQPL